jgi:hypothetical protein
VPKKKAGEGKKIPAAPQNLLNIEDILREE